MNKCTLVINFDQGVYFGHQRFIVVCIQHAKEIAWLLPQFDTICRPCQDSASLQRLRDNLNEIPKRLDGRIVIVGVVAMVNKDSQES